MYHYISFGSLIFMLQKRTMLNSGSNAFPIQKKKKKKGKREHKIDRKKKFYLSFHSLSFFFLFPLNFSDFFNKSCIDNNNYPFGKHNYIPLEISKKVGSAFPICFSIIFTFVSSYIKICISCYKS